MLALASGRGDGCCHGLGELGLGFWCVSRSSSFISAAALALASASRAAFAAAVSASLAAAAAYPYTPSRVVK